jgi:hypothetical protein
MPVLYDGTEYEVTESILYYIFKNEFSFKYNRFQAPKYTQKTSRIFKQLLEEQGEENSVDIVKFGVIHWRDLQRKAKVTGLPTAEALFGYRTTIMSLIIEPKKNSVEYDGTGKDKYRKHKRTNKNKLFIGK